MQKGVLVGLVVAVIAILVAAGAMYYASTAKPEVITTTQVVTETVTRTQVATTTVPQTVVTTVAPPRLELKLYHDGVVVKLSEPVKVDKVEVYLDGEKVAEAELGKEVSEVDVPVDASMPAGASLKVVAYTEKGEVEAETTVPARFTPEVIAKLLLKPQSEVVEDKAYYNAYTWKSPAGKRTALCFSPDGSKVAVLTYDGRVVVLNARTGEKLWEKQVPEASFSFAAFTKDGKYLVAGERSLTGTLYCFNAETGEEVWSVKSSDFIGEGRAGQSAWDVPTVYWIETCSDGMVVFSCARKEKVNKTKICYCKIVAVDENTGKVLWVFPEEGYIDTPVPKLVATEHYVIFNVWGWYAAKDSPWKFGTIAILDRKTGELLAKFTIPPRKPWFSWVGIWYGLDADEAKDLLVVLTGDARLLAYKLSETIEKKEPALLWNTSLETPIEVAPDSYIYAYGSTAMICGDHVVAITSLTYGLGGLRYKKPGYSHPNATTLFCFSLNGKLEWRYKLGGMPAYPCVADYGGRYLVVGVKHDWVTSDISPTGAYVFDLERPGTPAEKCVLYYPATGLADGVAISPDGSLVALVERTVNAASSEKAPASFIGDYDVVILR